MDEPLIESRTAAEVDDACGMRYWWNFHEAGIGIVPEESADALVTGKEIHEDLQAVAMLPDDKLTPEGIGELVGEILKEIPPDHTPTSRMEHLYRRAGWLAGFGLFIEPIIRSEFENIHIEHEIVLDRDPLWVPITPDRVLRHKKDRYLVYKEYKSTISSSLKWMTSWVYAIQLHLGITAIEEELEEKVAYGQIIGLMKGDYRGRLIHPYVWGYYNESTNKWSSEYHHGSDWQPRPVWEYEDGLVAWVLQAGKEVALAQFPHSLPVFKNERMVDDWVNRRAVRQATIKEIKSIAQVDWDQRVLYFEPRLKQCRPAFGDPCPYLRCCWSAEVNENPLAGHGFVQRTPHHELEVIGVEE